MKSTLHFSFVVIIAVLLLSCKKEKTSSQPAPTNTNPNPQSPATLYDGVVRINHTSPIGSAPSTYYNITSLFHDSSIDLINPPSFSYINVGTVTVNTRILKSINGPSGPSYVDTTNQISGPVFNIAVSGNSSVNPFTLYFNQGYPALGNTGQVPSVITRSAGLSFTLTNISETDSIRLNIITPNNFGTVKYATVHNGSASFSLTPAELQNQLSATSIGSINLTLMRTNKIVSSASKNYSFYTEEYYTKTSITVN